MAFTCLEGVISAVIVKGEEGIECACKAWENDRG